MGLIGGVRKTAAHLYLPIFKKELEGRAKRGDHEDNGQEAPTPLNIAPTKSENETISWNEDYGLKFAWAMFNFQSFTSAPPGGGLR